MEFREIIAWCIGIGLIFLILVLMALAINETKTDINIKDLLCRNSELGNYAGFKQSFSNSNTIIDGQKYFKCTKDTYNSTTKEIITSEKWVKLP